MSELIIYDVYFLMMANDKTFVYNKNSITWEVIYLIRSSLKLISVDKVIEYKMQSKHVQTFSVHTW